MAVDDEVDAEHRAEVGGCVPTTRVGDIGLGVGGRDARSVVGEGDAVTVTGTDWTTYRVILRRVVEPDHERGAGDAHRGGGSLGSSGADGGGQLALREGDRLRSVEGSQGPGGGARVRSGSDSDGRDTSEVREVEGCRTVPSPPRRPNGSEQSSVRGTRDSGAVAEEGVCRSRGSAEHHDLASTGGDDDRGLACVLVIRTSGGNGGTVTIHGAWC